jgi:hypothetical protein
MSGEHLWLRRMRSGGRGADRGAAQSGCPDLSTNSYRCQGDAACAGLVSHASFLFAVAVCTRSLVAALFSARPWLSTE